MDFSQSGKNSHNLADASNSENLNAPNVVENPLTIIKGKTRFSKIDKNEIFSFSEYLNVFVSKLGLRINLWQCFIGRTSIKVQNLITIIITLVQS